MKKALIIVGAILGVLLIAVAIAPFFIDVNQFKEPIESKIEDNINGDAKLGSLSLSLWTGINVGIESFTIESPKGTQLIATKEASVFIPYTSLIAGEPIVQLQLFEPEIFFRRKANGEINLTTLLKQDSTKPQPKADEDSAEAGASPLPDFVTNAQASVKIEDGVVKIEDKTEMALAGNVSDLDLEIRNLSLSEPISFYLDTMLDVSTSSATLQGETIGQGVIEPRFENGKFLNTAFNAEFDFTDVRIESGEALTKPSSFITRIHTDGSASQSKVDLNQMKLEVGPAVINGKINMSFAGEKTTAKGQIESNNFDLQPFIALSPQYRKLLEDYDPKGSASFTADFNLPATGDIQLNGKLSAEMSGKVPSTGEKLDFKTLANANNQVLTLNELALELGKTDVKGEGKLSLKTPYKGDFLLIGDTLDVDGLMPPEQKQDEQKEDQAKPAAQQASAAATKETLRSLRSNQFLKQLFLKMNIKINQIHYSDSEIKNFTGELSYQPFQIGFREIDGSVFGGGFQTNGSLQLQEDTVQFQNSLKLSKIKIQEMLKAYFPKYQNTVEGAVTGGTYMTGSGLTVSKVKQTLTGQGEFLVKDGVLHLIDIVPMIKESVSKIPKLATKLEDKKDKSYQAFQQLLLKFAISDSNLVLKELAMTGPQKGVDIAGEGIIGFDQSLDLYVTVKDTHGNLVEDWSDLEKVKNRNGQVNIPFHVQGQVSSPKVDYDYTGKRLVEAAAKRRVDEEKEKLKGKAVEKIKEKIPEKYRDKADKYLEKEKLKEVEDKAKDLFKKIF